MQLPPADLSLSKTFHFELYFSCVLMHFYIHFLTCQGESCQDVLNVDINTKPMVQIIVLACYFHHSIYALHPSASHQCNFIGLC